MNTKNIGLIALFAFIVGGFQSDSHAAGLPGRARKAQPPLTGVRSATSALPSKAVARSGAIIRGARGQHPIAAVGAGQRVVAAGEPGATGDLEARSEALTAQEKAAAKEKEAKLATLKASIAKLNAQAEDIYPELQQIGREMSPLLLANAEEETKDEFDQDLKKLKTFQTKIKALDAKADKQLNMLHQLDVDFEQLIKKDGEAAGFSRETTSYYRNIGKQYLDAGEGWAQRAKTKKQEALEAKTGSHQRQLELQEVIRQRRLEEAEAWGRAMGPREAALERRQAADALLEGDVELR